MRVLWGGRGGVSPGPDGAEKASQKNRRGTNQHVGLPWMRMKPVRIVTA